MTALSARLAGPVTRGEKRRALATLRMIEDLPDDGAIVIVHTQAAVAPLRTLIAEKRGAVILSGCRVLVAPSLADEQAMTSGLSSTAVVHDPFVHEHRDYLAGLAKARVL